MSNLQALLAQQAELEKKISEIQREERSNAVAKVRAMMSEFGLSSADISGRSSAPRAQGAAKPVSRVAVKYRNAATGDTWTGRGLQPKWLRAALASGAKIDDFAV